MTSSPRQLLSSTNGNHAKNLDSPPATPSTTVTETEPLFVNSSPSPNNYSQSSGESEGHIEVPSLVSSISLGQNGRRMQNGSRNPTPRRCGIVSACLKSALHWLSATLQGVIFVFVIIDTLMIAQIIFGTSKIVTGCFYAFHSLWAYHIMYRSAVFVTKMQNSLEDNWDETEFWDTKNRLHQE